MNNEAFCPLLLLIHGACWHCPYICYCLDSTRWRLLDCRQNTLTASRVSFKSSFANSCKRSQGAKSQHQRYSSYGSAHNRSQCWRFCNYRRHYHHCRHLRGYHCRHYPDDPPMEPLLLPVTLPLPLFCALGSFDPEWGIDNSNSPVLVYWGSLGVHVVFQVHDVVSRT